MNAYAIIETGGKQYIVEPNTQLEVELLKDVKKDDTITFDKVLAVSDGKVLKLGMPYVEGAKVTALVQDFKKGKKVIAFKKKRRKGYSRKKGHRQQYCVVKIQAIA